MVRYYYTVAADIDATLRIRYALNPFDRERLPTTNLLPRLDQPRHLFPAVRSAMPDVVDPQCTGLVRLGLGIDSGRLQSPLEHGI